MADIMNTLFGPLAKDYCLYFYILSIVGFILLAAFLISAIIYGISKRKGLEYYLNILALSVGYGIFYFQNRLLHSMCVASK